jgi:hypothetical protein
VSFIELVLRAHERRGGLDSGPGPKCQFGWPRAGVRGHLQAIRLDSLRAVFLRRAKSDAAVLVFCPSSLGQDAGPAAASQIKKIAHVGSRPIALGLPIPASRASAMAMSG